MNTITERTTDCTQTGLALKRAAVRCDGEAAAVTQHLNLGSDLEALLHAADAYAGAVRRLDNELADKHTQILTEPHR